MIQLMRFAIIAVGARVALAALASSRQGRLSRAGVNRGGRPYARGKLRVALALLRRRCCLRSTDNAHAADYIPYSTVLLENWKARGASATPKLGWQLVSLCQL